MDEHPEMRENLDNLDADYREMARDVVREAEALEWAEATISDSWPPALGSEEGFCDT